MRLYTVRVIGGGTFLYDLVDLGRLAQRMADEGDDRLIVATPHWRFGWRRGRMSETATPEDDDRPDVERLAREMRERLAPADEGPIIRPKSTQRIVEGDA